MGHAPWKLSTLHPHSSSRTSSGIVAVASSYAGSSASLADDGQPLVRGCRNDGDLARLDSWHLAFCQHQQPVRGCVSAGGNLAIGIVYHFSDCLCF